LQSNAGAWHGVITKTGVRVDGRVTYKRCNDVGVSTRAKFLNLEGAIKDQEVEGQPRVNKRGKQEKFEKRMRRCCMHIKRGAVGEQRDFGEPVIIEGKKKAHVRERKTRGWLIRHREGSHRERSKDPRLGTIRLADQAQTLKAVWGHENWTMTLSKRKRVSVRPSVIGYQSAGKFLKLGGRESCRKLLEKLKL